MDLQTIIALIIVATVAGRFIYNWIRKRHHKQSGSCACDKDDCQ